MDGANLETWTIQAGEDDNPCPRCNGKVFDAEKMASLSHVYHKKCFTCKECARLMDQFIACDAPDGMSCPPSQGLSTCLSSKSLFHLTVSTTK